MSDSTRVKVYTSVHCGYCRAAKALLDQRGIPFEEIDLSGDHDARNALVERTGWRTVPVIEIDGALIGALEKIHARVDAIPEGGVEGLHSFSRKFIAA